MHESGGQPQRVNDMIENLKVTTVQEENKTLMKYLLNFRNNCLCYLKLALFLSLNDSNKIFSFLLTKKHLQNLTLVMLAVKKAELPGMFGLNKTISKQEWESLCKSQQIKKMMAVYSQDVEALGRKYTQFYKNLLNTKLPPEKLPSFDLNTDYQEQLVGFCQDMFQAGKNVLKSAFSRTDVDEYYGIVQRIMVYEKYTPDQIFLF